MTHQEGRYKRAGDYYKIAGDYLRIGPVSASAGDMFRADTWFFGSSSVSLIVPLGALALIAVTQPLGDLPDVANVSTSALSGITRQAQVLADPANLALTVYSALGTGVEDTVDITLTGSPPPFKICTLWYSAGGIYDGVVQVVTDSDTRATPGALTADVSLALANFLNVWTVGAGFQVSNDNDDYKTQTRLDLAYGNSYANLTSPTPDGRLNYEPGTWVSWHQSDFANQVLAETANLRWEAVAIEQLGQGGVPDIGFHHLAAVALELSRA